MKTLLGTVKGLLQGIGIRGIAFRIQSGIQLSAKKESVWYLKLQSCQRLPQFFHGF